MANSVAVSACRPGSAEDPGGAGSGAGKIFSGIRYHFLTLPILFPICAFANARSAPAAQSAPARCGRVLVCRSGRSVNPHPSFRPKRPSHRHFDRSGASGEIRLATGAGRTPELSASTERRSGFSTPPRPGAGAPVEMTVKGDRIRGAGCRPEQEHGNIPFRIGFAALPNCGFPAFPRVSGASRAFKMQKNTKIKTGLSNMASDARNGEKLRKKRRRRQRKN